MDANNAVKELEKIYDELESDWQKYLSNISKYMAQDISYEMEEVAHNAIEKFYEHYNPEDYNLHNGRVYYYRNWNFKKSYKRYYKNRHPFYTGGVQLLINDLPDVYSGTDSSPIQVWHRVYAGYHGIASFQSAKGTIESYVPIMSPSPIELITDKYRYIVKNLEKYEKKAASKAKKDSYIRMSWR